jgi:AraC-like DNA-binding protein
MQSVHSHNWWKIMFTDSATTTAISPAFTPAALQPRSWPAPAPDRNRSEKRDNTGKHAFVDISSAEGVNRRHIAGYGVTAEFVRSTSNKRTEYRFRSSSVHLLVVFDEAKREAGESSIEGLPPSTQRNLSHKLIFVPAGRAYSEWHAAQNPIRLLFIYLDSNELGLETDTAPHTPRLLFEDSGLRDSALRFKRAFACNDADDRAYFDALGIILLHELKRLNHRGAEPVPHVKGGLALYHQRIVTTFIEEHLSEPIALATLAQLTQLSPYHFCRAFKQSFGAPPHRYHATRRIERAKALLAKRSLSVTEIGLELGFCETSSFCSAFRKATGESPTAYRRGLY